MMSGGWWTKVDDERWMVDEGGWMASWWMVDGGVWRGGAGSIVRSEIKGSVEIR